MDPIYYAAKALHEAKQRGEKKAIKRAQKAYDKLKRYETGNLTVYEEWYEYIRQKLRPPQKSPGQSVIDAIVKSLRKR